MTTKLTIVEVRKRLAVNTEYTARYLDKHKKSLEAPTRRRVVRNNKELVSLHLEGVLEGREIVLPWAGVKAEEVKGKIVLSTAEMGQFMEITITGHYPPSPAEGGFETPQGQRFFVEAMKNVG